MQRRSVWDYSIEAAKSISQRGTDLYMLSLEVLQFLNSPGLKSVSEIARKFTNQMFQTAVSCQLDQYSFVLESNTVVVLSVFACY